jgi:gliding motility-associated-like protein
MDSLSKTVYVAPKAEVSYRKSDSLICQGEAVDFAGTATENYYKLEWDFRDGEGLAMNQINIRKAFQKGGVFPVTFRAYYTVCGMVETTQTMNVTGVPLVNLGPDTVICAGGSRYTLQNLNSSTAMRRYLWSTGDTLASLPVMNAGKYWLRVSEGNCSASDSVEVKHGCYLDLPNAFNPNDNNPLNAYFLPRNLLGKSITTFEMRIFDRWGVLLFETNSIDGRGWDGKYRGADQPMGVYVYQIQVSFEDGKSESYNGNVTLLR